MQRTRTDRRKRIIVFAVVSVLFLGVLVGADLYAKFYFERLIAQENGRVTCIENFFYFDFIMNSGSAYGLFSDKTWAQLFFKILTPIAVVVFSFVYIYAFKRNCKLLLLGIMLVIAGSLGNFVDRLAFDAVRDFICIEIAGNRIFGIFNLADVFLSVGVVLIIVHLLFLDKNALFRIKRKTVKNQENLDKNNETVNNTSQEKEETETTNTENIEEYGVDEK